MQHRVFSYLIFVSNSNQIISFFTVSNTRKLKSSACNWHYNGFSAAMSPLVAQSLMGGAAAFSKLPPGIGVAAPAALKGIAPLLCAPGAGNNAASVQALISQLQQASGTSAAATSLGLNPFAAANQAGLQQQALNFNPLVRFLSTRVPKKWGIFCFNNCWLAVKNLLKFTELCLFCNVKKCFIASNEFSEYISIKQENFLTVRPRDNGKILLRDN